MPVSPSDSDEILLSRINQLSGDEYEIYKWLREFYSKRWIAETLMLEINDAKVKIKSVYLKLGVKNKNAFSRVYGRLERPQKGPVDTQEIDSYVDTRTENTVQKSLDEVQ